MARSSYAYNRSDRKILIALLLLIFLPFTHRIYAGKLGTALLFLVTAGGFGVWWIIDLIMLVAGSFRDAEGRRIEQWT